jgi:hypothetical protein
MFGHPLDGVVRVVSLEYSDPAQLLFCLDEGTVCDCQLSSPPLQRGCTSSPLHGLPSGKVTIPPELVVIGKSLVHESIPLLFGHSLPRFLVRVANANVFHGLSQVCCTGSPGSRASGRPVGKSWGDDCKRHFTVRRGDRHRCGAHVARGLTLRGLRRTRMSLADNGQGQWEVERRTACHGDGAGTLSGHAAAPGTPR